MSWRHISDETPTARKPHECFLCGLPIAKGERHVKRRGSNDGVPITFRMHARCNEVAAAWDEDDWLIMSGEHGAFRRDCLGESV
jgi:hypothetical protein